MKAYEFLTEAKKLPAEKPRNFVAKNAKMGGAGAHKDKKKEAKQGNIKHKGKEVAVDEADGGGKIEQLENLVMQLEQLLPAVTKAQKNHFVFEKIESEIGLIAEAAKELSDRSAIVDINDSLETAVQHIRQANGAIYEIEKTLKGLIKHTNYALDDARDEAQYEDRFGSNEGKVEEGSKIPFAGAKVGHKEGEAGQWRNKGPKKNKPAKAGDLVGGA